MSQKPSERRSPPYLAILLAGALLSGGAFFWSNWKPGPRPIAGDSVAFAAPQSATPQLPGAKFRPTSKAERAAVIKTISAQLKAFNQENWKEAVKYQSDTLKGNFPTPEAFGAMIKQVYPVFVQPKKVEFGSAVSASGHVQIQVRLTGEDDSVTRAIYMMAKEKGNYRIEGVAGGEATPADPNAAAV